MQGIDATPVELDGATDTISTRAEDDHRATIPLIGDVVVRATIGEVEVVGLCRIFSCERVDLLDDRDDAELLTL